MTYNSAGTLWFITQQHWTGATCAEEPETLSVHEFRSTGRNMRLTRQREGSPVGEIVPGSTVWHDYDGDEIYADVAVAVDEEAEPPTLVLTPTAAHEAGIGTARTTAAPGCETGCPPQYLHGDQIGSTREITGAATTGVPPAAEVVGSVVYTAFGEKVFSDGAIGRYQYAGAWGYQSGLYEDASGNLPFVHVGHRWYDPSSGRFLQRDPIGIYGGLNAYEYAFSSPVILFDPLGLWTLGFEFEFSLSFLGGVKIAGGFHFGYSKYCGLTGGVTGSAGWNVGPMVAASAGLDVVVTNADSVDDLSGVAEEVNVGLGPINVEGMCFEGCPKDGVPQKYQGAAIGIGAGGCYGVSYGKTGTKKAGRGNSTPIRGGNPGL